MSKIRVSFSGKIVILGNPEIRVVRECPKLVMQSVCVKDFWGLMLAELNYV